jgi:6-phosphofructokinase 1
MNPFIRAFVRFARNRYGATVLGIKDGFGGAVRLWRRTQAEKLTLDAVRAEIETHAGLAGLRRRGQELVQLDHAAVSGLVGQGGTILGAGRCEPFRDENVRRGVIDLLDALGVGALVIAGGAGSLAAASDLVAESCVTIVGVPATIDNDTLQYTETALGFDTAVSDAAWAVERSRDTAMRQGCVLVVETMGRASGHIAEAAALAGGAEMAVIPEQGLLTGSKVAAIGRRLEQAMADGLSHPIIVIAEGVELPVPRPMGAGAALTSALRSYFRRTAAPAPGTEVRLCVLGHPQRGGPPTVHDRLLAARYAEAAAWATLAADPPRSGVVGLRQGRFVLQRFDATLAPDPHAAPTLGYQLQKAN